MALIHISPSHHGLSPLQNSACTKCDPPPPLEAAKRTYRWSHHPVKSLFGHSIYKANGHQSFVGIFRNRKRRKAIYDDHGWIGRQWTPFLIRATSSFVSFRDILQLKLKWNILNLMIYLALFVSYWSKIIWWGGRGGGQSRPGLTNTRGKQSPFQSSDVVYSAD